MQGRTDEPLETTHPGISHASRTFSPLVFHVSDFGSLHNQLEARWPSSPRRKHFRNRDDRDMNARPERTGRIRA